MISPLSAVRVGGWIVAGVALALLPSAPRDRTPEPPIPFAEPGPTMTGTRSDTSAAQPLGPVPHGVFRATRQPPATSYAAWMSRPVIVDVVPDPPPFTVTGTLLGREPVVLLELSSGSVGTVLVAVGDSIAGYQVARVLRDTVWFTRGDHSWPIGVGQR